jgi:hypothetical protein
MIWGQNLPSRLFAPIIQALLGMLSPRRGHHNRDAPFDFLLVLFDNCQFVGPGIL